MPARDPTLLAIAIAALVGAAITLAGTILLIKSMVGKPVWATVLMALALLLCIGGFVFSVGCAGCAGLVYVS
jgi:hypothetical protein